jgi:hypothetical protein
MKALYVYVSRYNFIQSGYNQATPLRTLVIRAFVDEGNVSHPRAQALLDLSD